MDKAPAWGVCIERVPDEQAPPMVTIGAARKSDMHAIPAGCGDRDDKRPAYGTTHGFTSQISAAYSAIVQSLEKRPEPARFMITVRAQPSVSAYSSVSRRSAAR